MCNLSEGLLEEGIEKGISLERARQEMNEENRILAMLRDKVDISFIAKYSPFPLERIQELGKTNGLL